MKKLLLAIMLLPSLSQGQQCPNYVCTNETEVCDELENVSYNTSSKCFSGSGVIKSSVTWNNWTRLSFEGNLNVRQVINMSGGVKKVYIRQGANIRLAALNMDNSDTTFNGGNLIVESWTSNNSSTNVIMMRPSATLKIGNTYYNNPPYTLNVVGNPTNKLLIRSCSTQPLPITLEYFVGNPLRWKFGMVFNVLKVELQYSTNGVDWLSREELYGVISNREYSSNLKENGYYRLATYDLDGTVSYSKVVSQKGNNHSPSQAKDILGRDTKPEGHYIQNNVQYFKY